VCSPAASIQAIERYSPIGNTLPKPFRLLFSGLKVMIHRCSFGCQMTLSPSKKNIPSGIKLTLVAYAIVSIRLSFSSLNFMVLRNIMMLIAIPVTIPTK